MRKRPHGAAEASSRNAGASCDSVANSEVHVVRKNLHTVRVFISYAREDAPYREWVKKLARRLIREGIDVRLDDWHLEPGLTIAEFMNREVRSANKILMLCSPKYRQKIHAMENRQKITGSGWESMLVASSLFGGSLPYDRLVVALARGAWKMSAPSFVEGLPYVDLNNGKPTKEAFGELSTRLWGTMPRAPKLGSPKVAAPRQRGKAPTKRVRSSDAQELRKIKAHHLVRPDTEGLDLELATLFPDSSQISALLQRSEELILRVDPKADRRSEIFGPESLPMPASALRLWEVILREAPLKSPRALGAILIKARSATTNRLPKLEQALASLAGENDSSSRRRPA